MRIPFTHGGKERSVSAGKPGRVEGPNQEAGRSITSLNLGPGVEDRRAVLGFLLSDKNLFPDFDALRREFDGSKPFKEMDPAYLDEMAKDLIDLRENPEPELRTQLFKKYGAA